MPSTKPLPPNDRSAQRLHALYDGVVEFRGSLFVNSDIRIREQPGLVNLRRLFIRAIRLPHAVLGGAIAHFPKPVPSPVCAVTSSMLAAG